MLKVRRLDSELGAKAALRGICGSGARLSIARSMKKHPGGRSDFGSTLDILGVILESCQY